MHELIAEYWWVSLLTVPGLALAFKIIAERSALVDALAAPLQRKLSTFEFSYPEHWVVTATTRDGRRFSGVVIDKRFRLESRSALPFAIRDVEDVAWEGLIGGEPGRVVQLSEGRSGLA
jgi:hypothetical protein